MLTYNQRAAEVMCHLVQHNAHGYSQAARAGNGTIESLTLSDGYKTSIHGGDYDCSEAVRMCYVAAGVLPRGCYMWTGNEVSLLTSHGFKKVNKTNLQVGDVLWRNGHTEMVISVNGKLYQAGFRINEKGTINGGRVGDQTGWEATYSTLLPNKWTYVLRYSGAQPKASAATSGPSAAVSMSIQAGKYECVVSALNVREGAGTKYAAVAKYKKGEIVTLDGSAYLADGCVWGRYTGRSGKKRYVAVRTTGGMTYLKKVEASSKVTPSIQKIAVGTYKIDAATLNVRTGPGTTYAKVAQYKKGNLVKLDGYSKVADGCVWGRYIGGSSGKYRYIAVRTTSGNVYAHKI